MDTSPTLSELIEVREQILKSFRWLKKLLAALEKKIDALQMKEAALKALREEQQMKAELGNKLVRLDVRGSIFEVSREDLLRVADTFFSAMLASEHWKANAEKFYFIDCCTEGFEQVVGVLRGEPLQLTDREGESVRDSLRFLRLPARGTYTYANGEADYDGICSGTFVNGDMDGYGTKAWVIGVYYEGEWRNHVKEGRGRITFEDGNVYDGEFKNDMIDGYGTYAYTNGDMYDGEWKDGQRKGHGRLVFANGDVYVGQFAHDAIEGQGSITWANGDVFIGKWRSGMRDGHGSFTFAGIGDVYVGQWKDDSMHGRMIVTRADGTESDRIYANGVPVGMAQGMVEFEDIQEIILDEADVLFAIEEGAHFL